MKFRFYLLHFTRPFVKEKRYLRVNKPKKEEKQMLVKARKQTVTNPQTVQGVLSKVLILKMRLIG